MAFYRKKPVVIEAFKLSAEEVAPDWWLDKFADGTVQRSGDDVTIKTLEGVMTARAGEWIIKGVHGELYPCKPDIFEKTYEPA